MRRKFFITLFSLIAATICLVSFLQYSFFQSERKRLIDRQIETVASALIASRLSVELMENLNEVDAIIQNAVVDNPIDLVINIYSEDADILYSNGTAKRLNLELNQTKKWQDVEAKGHSLRLLTLRNGDIYLQIGMVLDTTLHRWQVDSRRFLYFLFSIFLLVGFVSFLSARFLVAPIANLATEFEGLSESLNRQLGQPLSEFIIPPTLERYSRDESSKDELENLGSAIRGFLKQLGDYTKSFQAQTALLTHEIKTPLTVILNRLEEMQRTPPENVKPLIDQAKSEVLDLASMVNNYLQWAVFISSPGKPQDVYAVKLEQVVREMAGALETIYGSRVSFGLLQSPTVFGYPEHVRQVVKNVLENALKYSKAEVRISLENETLVIEDSGSGIPPEILKAIGTPFNNLKGSDPQRSSGLGLAWAHVICQKNGWKLNIDSRASGTKVEIIFVS